MVGLKWMAQQYFPPSLCAALEACRECWPMVQEIRCRVDRPMLLVLQQYGEQQVMDRVTAEELQHIMNRLTQGSAYAWQEQYRQGYLTLPGGHRVGFTGTAVVEHGVVVRLRCINSINFRLARQLAGVADGVMPLVVHEDTIRSTLLVAPPGCGKTTMLRDVVRQLSNGVPGLGFSGVSVGLVDERGELAGCVQGIPQLDVGCRTDVLDGCPKGCGLTMLIRSMAPRAVAVDELATAEDVAAVAQAMEQGVAVLATAHGGGLADLLQHPNLSPLVRQGGFPVILGLRWHNGHIVWQQQEVVP